MSTQILDLLRLLPDWLSAIGTIAAVIVALFLARRDQRIRLAGSANVYVLFERGDLKNPHYVALTITNVGTRTFMLTGISWRTGVIKKHHFFILPPANDLSSRLPLKLADGDQAALYLPLEDSREVSLPSIREFRPKHLRWLWNRSHRLIAHTSTREKHYFTIHKTMRTEISR